MNPGGDFETSVVVNLVILVTLVKRKIGKDYYKSGILAGRPSISPFLSIIFGMIINT